MHRYTGRATDIKTQTHARTHTPTQMFFILCPYMYVTHLKRASQHGPESCSSMVTHRIAQMLLSRVQAHNRKPNSQHVRVESNILPWTPALEVKHVVSH